MAVVQQATDAEALKVSTARGVLNWFFNKKATPIWILLGVFTLAFWPTYLEWWTRWTMYQSAFGYGYLVPPTVLYLIWCRRDQISAEPKEPGKAWILIPIIVGVLLQCVALLARISVLQSAAFFILLMSVPYFMWGGRVYRHIWGALAYTAVMLPWPPQIYGKLLLPAQEISMRIALKLLQWTGVGVEVTSGTRVATDGGYSFEVAAACSGLTIVFPVVAIVILNVMMVKAHWSKLLFLLILAIPLSVFSNAVRIWTIAMIGEHWGAEMADSLHDPSGIAAIIFATVLLTLIMSLIKAMDFRDEYVPAFAKYDEAEEDREEE